VALALAPQKPNHGPSETRSGGFSRSLSAGGASDQRPKARYKRLKPRSMSRYSRCPVVHTDL